MHISSSSRSFRHFSRYLFLVSNIYLKRNKAREDLHSYLEKMRDSIIKMRLSYTHIDKLKEKIENSIELERRYARFFRIEDKATQQLRRKVKNLEGELTKEIEEIQQIINENNDKTSQLSESLVNVKSKLNHLMLENGRRQQRMRALEQKIRQKVDVHKYYS